MSQFTFLKKLRLFWLCLAACRIFIPQPGTKSVSPTVEAWSLNHCAAGEVPNQHAFDGFCLMLMALP